MPSKAKRLYEDLKKHESSKSQVETKRDIQNRARTITSSYGEDAGKDISTKNAWDKYFETEKLLADVNRNRRILGNQAYYLSDTMKTARDRYDPRNAGSYSKDLPKSFTDYRKTSSGWLDQNGGNDPESAASRQKIYQNNQNTVNALKNQLRAYGWDSSEFQSISDRIEQIENENRMYERGQMRFDQYSTMRNNDDFAEQSKNHREGMFSVDKQKYAMPYSVDSDITDKLGTYRESGGAGGYQSASYETGNPDTAINFKWLQAMKEGVDKGWDHLTEDEISNYYYLLNTQGQGSAYQYLEDLSGELGRRQAENIGDVYNSESTLKKIAMNIATVPNSVVGGVSSVVDDAIRIARGEELQPYNSNHIMQNAVAQIRGATAKNINDATGNASLPFVGTTAGDVYQALMSGADSLLGGLGMGRMYTPIMGMSAASSKAQELYDKGASREQIAFGSITSGIAEAMFEYVSLDKFLSEKSAKGMKDIVFNVLTQAGVEASEEMCTEVANIFLDAVNMRSNSEWAEKMNKGGIKGAILESVGEVLNAGIGGAVSGGAMAGLGSSGNAMGYNIYTADYGRQIAERGDAGAYGFYGEKNDASSKLYQSAKPVIEKASKNGSDGMSRSDYRTLGRYADSVDESLSEKSTKESIRKYLEERGDNPSDSMVDAIYKHYTSDASVQIGRRENKQIAKELKGNRDFSRRTDVRDYENRMSIQKEYEAQPDQQVRDRVDIVSTTDENGELVPSKIAGIADTKEKTLRMSDGSIVSMEDVEFDSPVQGRIYDAVMNLGASPETSQVMIDQITANRNIPIVDAIAGVREAYTYGKNGIVKKGSYGLEARTYDLIYRAGKMDSGIEVSKKQAAVEANMGAVEKVGRVTIPKKFKDLTQIQKSSVYAMDVLTEKFTNNQVEFYDTYRDENGKIVFAHDFYQFKKGEEAPNGFFRVKDGTVCIDLNAGADAMGTSLFTASHEFTHFTKQFSPEKYKALADFLVSEYDRNGYDVDTLIANQMRKAEKAGHPISYEEALDEVVADSMESMLTDQDLMSRMAKLKAQDETLFEKLKNFFLALAKKIASIYKDLNPDSTEGKIVKGMKDSVDKIADMFAEALVDAGNAYKKLESVGVLVDTDTESASPVDLSLRTWEESDYTTAVDEAAGELSEAIGISKAKAKAYINDVNSIAKMIAEDKGRLDYFDTGKSPFVSNSEYGGSFDYTTLCKKRRLLTGTFSAIQEALPNTALTAQEILDIRAMMDKAGLEVSCGKCYVEGSRANMGTFTKKFIELYKKYYPGKWYPDMNQMNTPDGIEKVRIEHPEVYEQYEYFWNHYGKLRPEDKNLFASQQKPKLYQMRSAYKGEILKYFKGDAKVEEKNINGGIRMQSFSDFEIVHLIDAMQTIMDMSRVGLHGQAYTKVPEFAWALGNTGLKINLSIDAWSVDDEGKLVFNNKEGMPFETAMELRNAYSKNVGTICCVYDDKQFLAALADDRIDFIIPFHRSQWKKAQYKSMGLPVTTKDYTYQQNEKWLEPSKHTHEFRGRQVKDKCRNYMPNEYWDFSKSGKENAENYLQMCAKDGKRPKFYKFLDKNSDGSYSLKKDGGTDGYWKLLIDFKMYDNDGNGSPQLPVRPDFNMDKCMEMLRDYKGGHEKFPVAHGIVDEFVSKYKESHKGIQYSNRSPIADTSAGDGDAVFFSDRVRDDMTHTTNTGETVNTKKYLESLKDEDVHYLYKSMSFWGYDKDGNAILKSPMAEKGDDYYIIPKDGDPVWYAATESAPAEGKEYPDSLLVKYKKPGNKTASYVKANDYPELVKEDWSNLFFKLERKNVITGKTEPVYARYNPYEHSSNLMLNDQFKGAYSRPNLVTVLMKVPKSEEGAYRAKYSKDPTGMTPWKSGDVAGEIGKYKDLKRNVFLSRFAAPVKIISDAEVAEAYKSYLDGTPVEIPDNVVSPSLLKELEKIGVPIKRTGKIEAFNEKQNKKKSTTINRKKQVHEEAVKFSERVTEEVFTTFFSGGGTFEAGLPKYEKLKQNHAVEWDGKIASVWIDNHGKESMFVGDVRDFRYESDKKPFYFHASPSCKSSSRANHKAGETAVDKTTAKATAEHLREKKPVTFTMENVVEYQGTTSYGYITDALNELGYKWDVHVYDASDYGNPTKRKRIFIRAVENGLELPTLPEKVDHKTSWYEATKDLFNEKGLKPASINESTMRAIRKTKKLKNLELLKQDKPLMIYGTNSGGTADFAWGDELAPTLTTKCGDARIIWNGHVYKPTPLFMGRLQGLPDDYKYAKKVRGKGEELKTSFTIIGNGIPTQLTNAVAGGLLASAYEQTHSGDVLFSNRDSLENDLTPDQREFFKDSKVVDDEGHLKVMYHGTPTGGFNVFDPSRSGKRGTFASSRLGMFFTDDKEYADSMRFDSRNENPETYSVYLNVKNPLRIFSTEEFDEAKVKEIEDQLASGDYDGIIDELGNVVVFDPSQIKRIDNVNPTDSDDIRFSDRDESISRRSILANAFADIAQNEDEKSLIEQYQTHIRKLNDDQKHLTEVRDTIREMMFTEGSRDDEWKATMKYLREDAENTANRINSYDKMLLKLEAAGPLMDVVSRERTRAYQKAKEDGKQYLDSYKQRRQDTEVRRYIKRIEGDLMKRMSSPTERKYIPSALAQGIIDMCRELDTTGRKQDSKVAEKYRSAKEAILDIGILYDRLENNPDFGFDGEFQKEFSDKIKELAMSVGGTPIRELSGAALQDVADIIHDIHAMIMDATKQIGTGEAIRNYEVGQSIIKNQEHIKAKGLVNGAVSKMFREWTMNPMRASLEMSGYDKDSALVKQLEALNEGRRKKEMFRMESTKLFDAHRSTKAGEKAFNDAVQTPVDFGIKDVNGNKVLISKMQAMSAILTWERERSNAGRKHLETPVRFPDVRLEVKGRYQDAFDNGKNVKITEDVINAFKLKMSDWDLDYMDEARKFFNGKAKDAVNDVSLITKHRLIAGEKNYIPYSVNQDYVARDSENVKSDISIESMGIQKSVIANARNQLVMKSLNDILSKHINDVATIYGMTIPVRNWNKAFNMRQTDDDGGISVKDAIRGNWKNGGEKLLDQAVADLQGNRRNDSSKFLSDIKSAFVTSTLAGNLSVWMKQAASFPTAFYHLHSSSAPAGLAYFTYSDKKKKAVWEEIDRYTAQHWIRRQGMSMQELGDMNQTNGWQNRLNKRLGKFSPMLWIQNMDVDTTAALWESCKADIKHTMKGIKPGSEEFFSEVTRLYDKVIEDTQPMYDPLHRAEITKNGAWNNFIMFQTQPIQNSGILRESANRVSMARKEFGRGSKEVRDALRKHRSAVQSQLVSHAVFTMMTFVAALAMHKVNPWRDKDKELTSSSITKHNLYLYMQNVISACLPVVGSYAFSIGEKIFGGSSYDVFSEPIIDKVNSTITMATKAKEDPSMKSFGNLLIDLSTYTGFPAKNVQNMINAIRLHLEDYSNGKLGTFDSGVYRTAEQDNTRLFKAIMNGDTGIVDQYKAMKGDSYTKMRIKALSENDPRIAIAAKYRNDGKADAYKKVALEIKSEKTFSQDEIVSAINTVFNRLRTESIDVDKKTGEVKHKGWFTTTDLRTAFENGSYDYIDLIREDLIDTKVMNGADPEKSASSVTSSIKSAIHDAMEEGALGFEDAKTLLERFGDMSKEDAESRASYWKFLIENPDVDISEAAVGRYQDDFMKLGISAQTFVEFYDATKSLKGEDLNGDGKSDPYTRMDKIISAISKIRATAEQKDEMFRYYYDPSKYWDRLTWH